MQQQQRYKTNNDLNCWPTNKSSKRRLSAAAAIIVSQYSSKTLNVGVEQINKIYYSWTSIDQHHMISTMFDRLFAADVNIGQYFRSNFDCNQQQSLVDNVQFRAHINRFVQFIDRIVQLLHANRIDSMIDTIRDVGQLHSRIPQLSFTADKWLAFKNAILDAIDAALIGNTSVTIISAWNILISFVISELKHAYMDGIRRVRSNSCPAIDIVRIGHRLQQESQLTGDRKISVPSHHHHYDSGGRLAAIAAAFHRRNDRISLFAQQLLWS